MTERHFDFGELLAGSAGGAVEMPVQERREQAVAPGEQGQGQAGGDGKTSPA